jgi:Tol biopolymer transport system component
VVALLALALWLAVGVRTGPKLEINVQPVGADVMVDNQIVGQTPLTLSLAPGQHMVRIQREDYIPWETQVLVRDVDISLERTLVYQPFISTLAQSALFPQWTPDGALLYVAEGSPPAIVQWNGTSAQSLAELPFIPITVEWSSDGSRVGVLAETFGYLDVIVLSDNKTLHVDDFAFGPAWKPDGRTLTFARWLMVDSPQTSAWSVEPGSAPVSLVTNAPQEMFGAVAAAWSPDESWLYTINEVGLTLWKTGDSGLSNVTKLSDVSYAAWSPDSSQVRLVYIVTPDNTMLLTTPQRLNPTILALNVSLPIRWSNDGNTLYYFAYRPDEGGSALWAVNPDSGTRTLLADSSIAFGKVIDFAVSLDGKRVAYVTDEHRLVLLTLGE